MTKSLIEELEIKTYLVNNDELIGTTETYPDSNKRLMFMSRMNNGIKVYKKKDVDLIIQKAREEITKRIEYKRDKLERLEQLSYENIYKIIEEVLGKGE